MGCVSLKSRLEKIQLDLDKKEANLKEYNDDLERLEKEIRKLIGEKRNDEAKLKKQKQQLLSKKRDQLVHEIECGNKVKRGLEQVIDKNKSVANINYMYENTKKELENQKEELKLREKRKNEIADLEDSIMAYQTPSELELMKQEGENKLNIDKNNAQIVEVAYPLANAAYPYEQLALNYTHNNQRIQQPQISQVKSFLEN